MTKQIPFKNRRTLTIDAGGLTLSGVLHLPSALQFRAPFPTVIVCPGLGSRKERHLDFGAYLTSAGFAALIVDLRGHGESGGSLDGHEIEDFGRWIAYLEGMAEVDQGRLAIRGSSLGGHYAIHTAAAYSALKAVVAICPAPEQSLIAMLEQQGNPAVIQDEDLYVRLDVAAYLTYLRRHDIFQAVTRLAPRPLFLIHAKGDETIPYSVSEELYQRARDPKRLLLLEGGSHGSAQHDPAVNEQVVTWLRSALR